RLDTQESFFTNRLNQPSSLSLGKYLTPKLYLEYKSRLSSSGLGGVPAPSLSWEAGNRIYLQYRLNRTWSFSTFYENTEEGNGKVKFDINWQIGF
ncbi:MAG: translocation/assembly module TamB domain-containing protein, partial [Calditrichaeota bacterium]|nr:translocation/assembly module TamB domain-containing protein [Calditrichota bacterium]